MWAASRIRVPFVTGRSKWPIRGGSTPSTRHWDNAKTAFLERLFVKGIAMIRFACPQCGRGFQVENKAAGKKAKCPKCGTVITVPAAEQSYFSGPVALPPTAAHSGPAASPLPAKPVAAAETGEIYRLAEPAPRNQDDFWNALPAPLETYPTSAPTRPVLAQSRTGRVGRSARSQTLRVIRLAAATLILIGITVVATLWAAGFLSKSQGGRTEQTDRAQVAFSTLHGTAGNAKKGEPPHASQGSGQGDSFQATYQEGVKLLDDGELEQAIATFGKAIQCKPDSATAYNARGVAYLRRIVVAAL